MIASNSSILSHFQHVFVNNEHTLPPKGQVTIHQRALCTVWFMCFIIYIINVFFKKKEHHKVIQDLPTDAARTEVPANDSVINIPTNKTTAPKPRRESVQTKDALRAAMIVGCIMFYYFFCDYLHYFPKSERAYNRDLFIFLCLLLFVVSMYFTTEVSETGKENKLLNREQTEEWKGWMQVMFVWYHYFRAAETYNAVRVYIAAYVWMTGFGNFSFFWIRKDFSLRRVVKMLFRLNFLVLLTTYVVDNSYMLYYICAMHTFWFLSVYVMMRPFHQYNENKKVMVLKFFLYFCVTCFIFDIPGVAKVIFAPFSFILNYEGSLHEWIFRSKLDHCATLIGMLCAYNHPNVEKFLKFLDSHRLQKQILVALTTVIFIVVAIWYKFVFVLTKYDYNKLHPYTSFIPILAYIFLRNSTPWLRQRHVHLFAVLGKITLETYISQLHVYLQSNAKDLIVYISGYPLVNFVVNTLIYLCLSNLLFHATITLNEYIFPTDVKRSFKNVLVILSLFVASYVINVGLLYV